MPLMQPGDVHRTLPTRAYWSLSPSKPYYRSKKAYAASQSGIRKFIDRNGLLAGPVIAAVEINQPLAVVTTADGVNPAHQDVVRAAVGTVDDAAIERHQRIVENRRAGWKA